MSSKGVDSDRTFSVALLVITILIAIAGGALYWYYTSRGSDFSQAKDAPRRFLSKPTTSPSDFEVTATSVRSFARRCGSAPGVLPLAFTGLERINDFSDALEVANELVETVPASRTGVGRPQPKWFVPLLARLGLRPNWEVFSGNR
jgi:hypothetical protein